MDHYWQTPNAPWLPGRGYQMCQHHPPKTVHGISIDEDTVQMDMIGGSVRWFIGEP